MEKEHTIREKTQKNRSGALCRYCKRGAAAAAAAPLCSFLIWWSFPNCVFFFHFRGLSFFYFVLRLFVSEALTWRARNL